MAEEIPIKNWGVIYHNQMHHGMDYDCRCGWAASSLLGEYSDYGQHVSGFDLNGPSGSCGTWIVILTCPKCFEHFWFHFPPQRISVELLAEHCSNWPKK